MANHKPALFLSSILMLSLVLAVSMAESRILGLTGSLKGKTPECDEVFGVGSGDNCFDITQTFNLTTKLFDSINPNLNCDALFVGQWLCVAGSA
ncbi:hypothetical protein POPTR_005G061780v4 [Populus trichocarpa]|uniref:LysM domain-containing protein n=1 Tax=Populus trichocarpa TaxID=3694 RepID=A0A3N7G888_POPTR|nr:hypothetical protein BDE02_05G049600 [Populus trichocarpa]RQO90087.1 hypothetical protein POPTR_005G061780v4 [Populus trichocarpa]